MSGLIAIRPATLEDAGILHAMLKDKAGLEGLASEFSVTEDALADMLSREKSIVLLVFCGDNPAGMANYHFEDSTFTGHTMINIMDLYTVPAFGGKGVAKSLLAHIGRIAMKSGYQLKIAPLISNTRPLEWYQKLGARASYDARVLRVEDVPEFLKKLAA